MRNSSLLYEEAIYNSKNKYPIYIIAMHSGTVLANVIKMVTKDEFSHVCISFNSRLDPLYSFGSKKVGGREFELTIHNPNEEFYKKYKAHYKVFVTFVSKDELGKMKKRMKWFIDNDKKLNYDIVGLVQYLFNISTDYKKYSYFCSRFVAEILSYGKKLGRAPSLFSPQEISNLYFTSVINGGEDFSKYNFRNTERNLEKIKNKIYDDIAYSESVDSLDLFFDNMEYVVEDVIGEQDPYEVYSSYHVEEEFKKPENVCWDEELYYKTLPDAIVSFINKQKKEEGSFDLHVYTDMGVGKTKFIGVIEIQVDRTSNFEYFWKKKINTIKEIFENTASGAMVGTGGNLYISGCMKKNTFVDADQQEKMDYVVHRDGMNDMFMFKDKKAKKITREELSKKYDVVECYCLDDPYYTENFLQVINKSHDINEFYTLLMGDNNTQRSFKDDIRFEQTIPFLDILSKIQRNLLCEFRMIKKEKYPNNNLIIERVDRNIQSLIDSPYCLETVFPVKEINEDVRNKMMVEQLKTLKEILPTIK